MPSCSCASASYRDCPHRLARNPSAACAATATAGLARGAAALGSRWSVGLDRQRTVARPLPHRAVIERQARVAELVEQKQIDGRRYTAAAVAHDTLVLADPLGLEFGFGVGQGGETLVRLHEARRRHIDAAGDAARSAVATWLQATVELRAERIDDGGFLPAEGRRNRAAVDEVARPRPCRKGRRRIAPRRPTFDRTTFGNPLVEAAVENRRIVKSQRFQHPPKTRCPHHAANAVEHDAHAGTDSMPAKRGFEGRGHRHHEVKLCAGVGELALQVEEIGPGDVSSFECRPPGYRHIRLIAASGRRFEIGRAIKYPKIRLTEIASKALGAYKGSGLAHIASRVLNRRSNDPATHALKECTPVAKPRRGWRVATAPSRGGLGLQSALLAPCMPRPMAGSVDTDQARAARA